MCFKMLLLSVLGLLTWGTEVWATTCYTDCEARFPKWYQEPDRKRCQAEKARACLTSMQLPGPTRLDAFDQKFQEVSRRLQKNFLLNGYVISLDKNGAPMHEGDSLLWSGLALATLPCGDGGQIAEALTDSVKRQGGRFLRIDPLPASYAGNETSRDAEVGAMFGFAMRARRCPSERAKLAAAWGSHYDFVKDTGKLHEGSNPNFLLNPSLRFLWDLVSYEMGYGDRPSIGSLHLFETGVTLSTTDTATRKTACYPVHLSTLLLYLTAKLGMPVSHLTRREFCHQTRDMELPLTDWFCDRLRPQDYLASYQFNQYEYRHQRCRWEQPDMDSKESSPALDFLVMKAVTDDLLR